MNIDNPWFEGRLNALGNLYGYVINFRHSAIEPYRTMIRIRKEMDYVHMASISIDPKGIPDGCGKDLFDFADTIFMRLVNELDEEIKRDSKTPSQEVYCHCSDVTEINAKEYNKMFVKKVYPTYPEIKNVIFNPPATIVFWDDGTKTVVKAQNNEHFDPEKGLSMAIAKKHFGNKGHYFEEIKKWTEKYTAEFTYEPANFDFGLLNKMIFADESGNVTFRLKTNPEGTDPNGN